MAKLISIVGYDKLGEKKNEGLRFAWENKYGSHYIESAAFVNRRKGIEEDICGYTTSVSAGCVLRAFGKQCMFCRTGNRIPYTGHLTYQDIAKQNVFMVLVDMHCKDSHDLAHKKREFAYMGQGEPGYSYTQVRMAIELTNRIMRVLGQAVHRHVFATSGIVDSLYAFKYDLVNYFSENVTLHFSLHGTNQRDKIMPINTIYSYKEVIPVLKEIYDVSGEKPCVGIMLFKDFQPLHKNFCYNNSYEEIRNILKELDPKKMRLSFCEYNESSDLGYASKYSENEAINVLKLAQDMGFEAKLFYSYGQEKQSACGMLGAKKPDKIASEYWLQLNSMADDLIKNNLL